MLRCHKDKLRFKTFSDARPRLFQEHMRQILITAYYNSLQPHLNLKLGDNINVFLFNKFSSF